MIAHDHMEKYVLGPYGPLWPPTPFWLPRLLLRVAWGRLLQEGLGNTLDSVYRSPGWLLLTCQAAAGPS